MALIDFVPNDLFSLIAGLSSNVGEPSTLEKLHQQTKVDQKTQDERAQDELANLIKRQGQLQATVRDSIRGKNSPKLHEAMGELRTLKETIAPKLQTKLGSATTLDPAARAAAAHSLDVASAKIEVSLLEAQLADPHLNAGLKERLNASLRTAERNLDGLEQSSSSFSTASIRRGELSDPERIAKLKDRRDLAEFELKEAQKDPARAGLVPQLEARFKLLDDLVKVQESQEARHAGLEVPETLTPEQLETQRVREWVQKNYLGDTQDFSKSTPLDPKLFDLKTDSEKARALAATVASEFQSDPEMQKMLSKSLTFQLEKGVNSLAVCGGDLEKAATLLRQQLMQDPQYGVALLRRSYHDEVIPKLVNDLNQADANDGMDQMGTKMKPYLHEFLTKHSPDRLSAWVQDIHKVHPDASREDIQKTFVIHATAYAEERVLEDAKPAAAPPRRSARVVAKEQVKQAALQNATFTAAVKPEVQAQVQAVQGGGNGTLTGRGVSPTSRPGSDRNT